MPAFCKKLKQLRGKLTVEDLAKRSGVAASSIYKAETTPKVMWKTVEKIYGGLFKTPQEHCDTLILWAIEQTDRTITLHQAAETARGIMETHATKETRFHSMLASITRKLNDAEQAELLEFIGHYRKGGAMKRVVGDLLEMVREKGRSEQ